MIVRTTSDPAAEPRSLLEARRAIRSLLDAHRREIEEETLIRAYAISDPSDADPAYREGLRASISVALDYAFQAVEVGHQDRAPVPPLLRFQARMAARHGVRLDTVLRRYLAGFGLLCEFLIAEAENLGARSGSDLQWILHGHAATLDALLAAISEEYASEAQMFRQASTKQRLVERIKRLLEGDRSAAPGLPYEIEYWHIAIACYGLSAPRELRRLAGALHRPILLAEPGEEDTWAWIGGRKPFSSVDLDAIASWSFAEGVKAGCGEPARGLPGWRISHRQARAALSVGRRTDSVVVRYRDVALLSAAVSDELLAASLRQIYLEPLDTDSDQGLLARQILRAYFGANGNISSASASLGLSRRTVAKRLRSIEDRIDAQLDRCRADLEIALALEPIVASDTS